MPSTTIKIPRTGTQSTIVLDCEEFEAVALESGGTLRAAAAGGRRRELAPELVDDAVNRARVRSPS